MEVDGVPVVDVDGSFLYKKYKLLCESGMQVSLPSLPSPPVSGWTVMTGENYQSLAVSIPCVTRGMDYLFCFLRLSFYQCFNQTVGLVYTYLAGHVGHTGDEGAFRALSRGYTHWASGRVDELQVNTNNPQCCHVRCKMKPSMKAGVYNTYMLLGCEGDLACIKLATCECAAGYVRYYEFIINYYICEN